MLDTSVRKIVTMNREEWDSETQKMLEGLIEQVKDTPYPVYAILSDPHKKRKNVSRGFHEGLVLIACTYILHKLTVEIMEAEDLEEQWGEDE